MVLEGNGWRGSIYSISVTGVAAKHGSVDAEGSVVVHDVVPHCIVSGMSAKQIERGFTEGQLTGHRC